MTKRERLESGTEPKMPIAELLHAARKERFNDELVQQLADAVEEYGRVITGLQLQLSGALRVAKIARKEAA